MSLNAEGAEVVGNCLGGKNLKKIFFSFFYKKKNKENIGKVFATDIVVLTGNIEKAIFHLLNNKLVCCLLGYLISLFSIKENGLTRSIEQT